MRICVVSEEYPPVTDYSGGIGSQYGRLAPAIAALGHEVHVITLPPAAGPFQTPHLGVHLHQVALPRPWPWRPLLRARQVAAEIRAHGPFDVVLAPEFRGEASLYARRQDAGPLATHLLTSSAQLLAVRPGLSRRERGGFHTRLVLALERAQARRSVALSVPSERIRTWALELWPELAGIPCTPIPLAIDLAGVEGPAAAGEPPPEFPRDATTVTLPSRLDGHKGAQFLIEALPRLLGDHPDLHLVFVGREGTWDGRPIREHLRELAAAHADRVHFLGAQPPEAYMATVAASTIVAIPSLWESFCLAAVEAMVLGRPVIGTRGHGFDAYLRDGENGLLVDRHDVDGLTSALARLLGDPELRRRLGAAGRETAVGLDARALAPRYAEWLEAVSRGST